jgi:hypothetical protein
MSAPLIAASKGLDCPTSDGTLRVARLPVGACPNAQYNVTVEEWDREAVPEGVAVSVADIVVDGWGVTTLLEKDILSDSDNNMDIVALNVIVDDIEAVNDSRLQLKGDDTDTLAIHEFDLDLRDSDVDADGVVEISSVEVIARIAIKRTPESATSTPHCLEVTLQYHLTPWGLVNDETAPSPFAVPSVPFPATVVTLKVDNCIRRRRKLLVSAIINADSSSVRAIPCGLKNCAALLITSCAPEETLTRTIVLAYVVT